MIETMPRRDFLCRMGVGLGGIAPAELLGRDGLIAGTGSTTILDHAPTSTAACITAPGCAG